MKMFKRKYLKFQENLIAENPPEEIIWSIIQINLILKL